MNAKKDQLLSTITKKEKYFTAVNAIIVPAIERKGFPYGKKQDTNKKTNVTNAALLQSIVNNLMFTM